MKLTTYTAAGRTSYGIVTDDGIVDLGARFPEAATLRDFLARDGIAKAKGLATEQADVALDAVTFEPVIPNPDKIICVGLRDRLQRPSSR